MKRSPPIPFLAAASTTTTTMSYRPYVRSNQGRRNYSDRPPSIDHQHHHQQEKEQEPIIIGDSHFQSVRDANQGFNPSGNFSNYRPYTPPAQPPPFAYHNVPPPYNPYSNPNQHFYVQPPTPPAGKSFKQNQQYYRRPQPPQGPINQIQFRPPPQQHHPQARPSKPLDYRNWEYANPRPSPQCERFTIMSYNILADYLAIKHRAELYMHIPPQFLNWQWRKRSIIFELGLWSADILCLQEVDRFQELAEGLKLKGYTGIWKMRTGDPVDGCAIFWRPSRFKLLHEEFIEYDKFGLRNNVAQICVFESLGCNSNKVVVCNIHVLFNPKRGDIKLGQIRILFDKAFAVSKLWDEAPVVICGDFNSTPESPLYKFIVEQKLNLLEYPRNKVSGQASGESPFRRPYNNSGVISAPNSSLDSPVANGNGKEEIEIDSSVFQELSIDSKEHEDSNTFLSELHDTNTCVDSKVNDVERFTYNPYDPSIWTRLDIETATGSADRTIMYHSLNLNSVYTEVEDCSGTRDLTGEPTVTSYHRNFQGTVDYIWRSEGLQTVGVLAPIPKHAMQWTQGFPTKKWGSDHIALVSELAFSPQNKEAE